MKKFSGILFVALALAMVLPACKKYEDGPTISLRTKSSRVVNTWSIDKVYNDGVDITTAYLSFQQDYKIEFKDDGTFVQSWLQGGVNVSYTGDWEFNSDKTGLKITENGVSSEWTILRLKNDELWVKETYTSGGQQDIYETHFITSE
jgi:hypothetical protein